MAISGKMSARRAGHAVWR